MTVAVLVAAPPSGGAIARRGEATAALEAAARARGADVVADAAALFARGWVAEKNLAYFGAAARLVDDGHKQLARVELEAAEQTFARAEGILGEHEGEPLVAAAWAEAAKWHGVALFELKRRDEAVRAFARAQALEPATELTEAVVRPEVARAFAAAAKLRAPPDGEPAPAAKRQSLAAALALDDVIDAAIAVDGGVLTYAATRRRDDCATDVVVATRPDELLRRLDEATCRPGATSNPSDAPAIAHPRPAPSRTTPFLTKETPLPTRAGRAWEKPLIWVGVVGALGVGVVLAVNLWPRDASYSLSTDFHQFALVHR